METQRYPILFVDDEAQNLITLSYALGEEFDIVTARSGAEALVLLEQTDFAVLLCDQRMPGMTGVELCEAARRLRPDTVRMIITAYSDVRDAMDAMNRGQVMRYLLKPWSNEALVEVLRTAIELFQLQRSAQEMELRLLCAGPGQVAVAAKTSLLHEINTPLHALVVTLEQGEPLLADLRRHVDSGSNQTLRDLVNDLTEIQSDFSLAVEQLRSVTDRYRRTRRPARLRCECNDVVASTARIIRREVERVAKFHVEFGATCEVAIDPTVLAQILMNLISNSVAAIEESGMKEASIVVAVRQREGCAVITVTDNGPGVSRELAARVFEPLFTTRSGGTGMGLAIARELAEQHGGTLELRTEEVGRTCLELRLPVL
jgi:signal transduction histidine kinase